MLASVLLLALFSACPGAPTLQAVTVSITPAAVSLTAGRTQTFQATVTGTDQTSVTWSVQEPAGGTMSADGHYQAPSSAGTFHVIATSAAQPDASATATVTVTAAQVVSVAVSPSTASLFPAGQQLFTTTVTGASNGAVTWSVVEAGGGSVTSGGLYTAPGTAGTYHVQATSIADATKNATATVTVNPEDPHVSLSPATASLFTGGQQQFTATVTGTSNTAVTWSVVETSGGSITSSGRYTAPSTAGTFHVQAASVADPARTASAEITVTVPAPVSVAISPSSTSIEAGSGASFTATVTGGTGNTAVTWTVQESGGGTITSVGLYQAPSSATPGAEGTYHVVATSVEDPAKSATAAVTVTPAVIHGTSIVHWVTTGQVIDQPTSLVSNTIVAHGSDGVARQATGTAQGDFTITGVPSGPYWLEVGTSHWFTETTGRILDLSSFALGHPDAQAVDPGTMLQFNLTGAAPWEQGDSVQLESPAASMGYVDLSNSPSAWTAPGVGDTSWTFSLDFSQLAANEGANLIASGDELTLYQLHSPALGAPVQFWEVAANKSFTTSSLAMLQGSGTTLSGSFSTVPTSALNVAFSRAAFSDLRVAVNPNAVDYYDAFYLDGTPSVATYQSTLIRAGSTPDYVDAYLDPGSTDYPISATYGEVLPTGRWTKFAYAGERFYVPFQLPGTTGPAYLYADQDYEDLLSAFLSAGAQPQVTPVRNPLINGEDLFVAHTGVTTTPTLSWTAPAVGVPTGYDLYFSELSIDGSNKTVAAAAGHLRTKNSSVTVPSGILQPGHTYALRLYANWEPNVDRTVAFNISESFPSARSSIISATFAP